MVIFRPSIPLSTQQQGRAQLLGYPPKVVDRTKFNVYSDSSAPCPSPGYVCECIDVPYCPSYSSYGYNEGLSRLSLASLIAQPALELEASLAAGLRFSDQETGLSFVSESGSPTYSKPIDLKAEGQTQSNQFSGTSPPSHSTQRRETSTLRGGFLEKSTQTPDISEKTLPQANDGAVSTKLRRPCLQGNIWLLGSANGTKKGGLDALANLSASEQASLARFTPPDTPSPEKNKAVLHRPLALRNPNDSACYHDNVEQHAHLQAQWDDEDSSLDMLSNQREGNAKRRLLEDARIPQNSPLTLDDAVRSSSDNFNKAQEAIAFESPSKLDKGKARAIDPHCIHSVERGPSSPVSPQDVHVDAAETLSFLGQARKFPKGKRKAIDLPSGQMVGSSLRFSLPPQLDDLMDAQSSPHLRQRRKLDKGKGKGKAIDPLRRTDIRQPPSPAPEQVLPWNGPILFHRQDDSILQGSPPSPRPGFKSLSAEKISLPLFPAGPSTSGKDIFDSIEGRGDGEAGPSNLPPTPRRTPRLRFKPLPTRDAAPLRQDKVDAHRKTPVFDSPACFFSDTDSEEGIEIPNVCISGPDRMEFLADTIRDHFQLPIIAPPKRAYDFPEPERTRRLLRFDREVATPYIAEHRSVQTSTYEEEENEAPYLQNACGGMINLDKSGDLFDEHHFRWRNAYDRMDKLGKAMTVWSHRGYGAPRSYMEHDKLAHEEMKKRRDCRERKVRAGKVFRRAKRAGLCVDREGFVVPPRKEPPRVPPGMVGIPSGADAWERGFVRQREMIRRAEKVAAGADDNHDSHEAILPSTEKPTSGEWHTPDLDDEGDSDIDEHPELDDLRLARGLPPRRYPARRLPPFDPMANLSLRNPASGDAQSSAMVFMGFDLTDPNINACPPSASTSPDDPNPKPYATFCPSWAARHFSSFVGKINHLKKDFGAQMPKVVLTTPTPEPTDDEWDSEEDEGWADEPLQSQRTAGTSFPGWDEAMVNGRLRSPQSQDPQPMGTFCPTWDPRHFEHFLKKQRRERARVWTVPKVVVTMPSPEPGEEGWDSEDEWEEGEWDDESSQDWVDEEGQS